MRWITLAVATSCLAAGACAPSVARIGPPPTTAQMAELWIDPGAQRRDLLQGPTLIDIAPPSSDQRFEVVDRDTRGFSMTYRVRDAHARQWNVKIGPEARTEVVASRLVWALGYHEVPSYFVERWIAVTHRKNDRRSNGVDSAKGELLGGARFRPHELGLKSLGTWSWQRNPFVGTRPYNGLLVLMMLLNSTDLKNDNNELYEVPGQPREHATRWYVVKDLGASLGETGRFDPRRGDLAAFEREPFVLDVRDGHVRFGFQGRHQELLQNIGVEDVRWLCERLQRLTDRQWRDAFRAGHFTDDEAARYLTRVREKIAQGLAL